MNLRSIPALVGQFGRKGKTAMTKPQDQPTQQDKPKLSPGDVAEPGTPGTGENVCPDCKGESGKRVDGDCSTCDGTGTLLTGAGKVIAEVVRRQEIRELKAERRCDREIVQWLLIARDV